MALFKPAQLHGERERTLAYRLKLWLLFYLSWQAESKYICDCILEN